MHGSSDGRAGALRLKGPEFESRSESYETGLQKSNLFEVTLVTEVHEPSLGKVCEPVLTMSKAMLSSKLAITT